MPDKVGEDELQITAGGFWLLQGGGPAPLLQKRERVEMDEKRRNMFGDLENEEMSNWRCLFSLWGRIGNVNSWHQGRNGKEQRWKFQENWRGLKQSLLSNMEKKKVYPELVFCKTNVI